MTFGTTVDRGTVMVVVTVSVTGWVTVGLLKYRKTPLTTAAITMKMPAIIAELFFASLKTAARCPWVFNVINSLICGNTESPFKWGQSRE